MKRLICCLMACAISAVSLAEEAPVSGPRISCDEPVFDFGTVDNRTTVEHTFILKNTGDTTLEIQNVRAACGCTVADINPKEVLPGGESRLTARLNLQGRSGPQSKSITITSNDPQNNQYVVTMNGTASQSLQMSTDRVMFGELRPGQEATQDIDIQTLAGTTMNIQGIETDNEHVSVEQEKLESGQTRLKVKMRGPLQPGNHNSMVRVKTDLAERPLIEIPVFASVIGEIIHAPQEIVLPADTAGTPLTRYVVLRSGAAGKFEISNIELPDPAMKSSILPFGAQGFRIQIENIVPAPSLNGQKIKISTSAATMSSIEVPIRIGN